MKEKKLVLITRHIDQPYLNGHIEYYNLPDGTVFIVEYSLESSSNKFDSDKFILDYFIGRKVLVADDADVWA